MIYQRKKLLSDILFAFFTLFVFASTFSIALAQVSLGLSLILFIVAIALTKYNPFVGELKWFYTLIGAYIVWMVISALMGDTPVKSIAILKEEWLFCAVPIAIYLMTKENYRRKLITAFAVGCGLFALYGLLQFFTGVHWFKSIAPNPGPEFGFVIKGNFPSPMTFGNFFGTAGGFFAGYTLAAWRDLEKRKKYLFLAVAVLSIAATLGSYNRGALLGLFVVFVLLGILLRNREIFFSLGTIVILSVVVVAISPGMRERLNNHINNELTPEYEGSRMFIWNNSLKITADNPVFGVGQGNFRYEYERLLRDDIPDFRKRVHAHNDIINISAIAGIPGALFFTGIWIAVFCYLRRQISAARSSQSGDYKFLIAALAGSTVFFVTSLTEATFADEEVRQMLMFVWAVGLFQLFPQPQKSG